MEHKEIHNLIKLVAETGVTKVKLKTEEFELKIENKQNIVYSEVINEGAVSNQVYTPPVQAQAQVEQAPVKEEGGAIDESNFVTIKSPMIGTFYRRASPEKDVFVSVGDVIKEGDTVCIIEAMKLFNEIESEVAGKIVKVLVEDATPVEYDQPLFLVDPKA